MDMDRDIISEKVVALKYSKANRAPKVVAKGSGHLAEQILAEAMRSDVAIHTDKALAENLSKLNLGEDIPEELFEIVAKIYAFIDKIDVIMSEAEENADANANEGGR